MELTPGLEWPPKPAARVMRDLAAWSAWYTGDPETLDRHYRTASTTIREAPGGWRKFWWGRPGLPGQSLINRLPGCRSLAGRSWGTAPPR